MAVDRSHSLIDLKVSLCRTFSLEPANVRSFTLDVPAGDKHPVLRVEYLVRFDDAAEYMPLVYELHPGTTTTEETR